MRHYKTIGIISALFLAFAIKVQAVGQIPVPTLDNVSVDATTNYDLNTNHYRYNYSFQNPGSNTGEIWNIKIDIRQNPRFAGQFDSSGLTIPYGNSITSFSEMLIRRQPLDLPVGTVLVPIGQQVPSGWNGGFGKDGYARFTAGNGSSKILPGKTMSGFTVVSSGVPTIREVQVVPNWALVVDDHDAVTEEQLEQAAVIEKNLPFTTYSLGPSGFFSFGSDMHWTQLADDLQQAINLGWITDNTLAQTLVEQLNFARQALDQSDGTLAKSRLQIVLQTMLDSSADQRNQEIFDLVTLNIENLTLNTPDTPIPFEPVYSLTPSTATHALNETHTVMAKVVNSADNDAPVSGYYIYIYIAEGPHTSTEWYGMTDTNGEFTFSYVGSKVGTDHIVWTEQIGDLRPLEPKLIQLASAAGNLSIMLTGFQQYPDALAQAEVTWTGGPDLVIPFFIPPEIITKGGNPVFVTEVTENIGILNAPASTTRYYLSDTLPVDPKTARVIGERRILPLSPQEISEQGTLEYLLPNDLLEGTYYMAACADADNEMAELDESNNCSFNRLTTSFSVVVPALEVANSPPDCSQAKPSVDLIWPPNHKLVNITINGVTDPDDDPISTQITSIRQDEPVNGLGDGDTSPDGFGVGTNTAQVRAERSGLLNGRVYEIGFTAEDGKGESCTSIVSVGVPHDKGGQPAPVNDGANFDSTVP